jgi:hypothetical protein
VVVFTSWTRLDLLLGGGGWIAAAHEVFFILIRYKSFYGLPILSFAESDDRGHAVSAVWFDVASQCTLASNRDAGEGDHIETRTSEDTSTHYQSRSGVNATLGFFIICSGSWIMDQHRGVGPFSMTLNKL